MLIVLSPAKALDYATPAQITKHTLPNFMTESNELIAQLRLLSHVEIAKLMGISDSLVALNMDRYANWSQELAADNSKQALLAFNGDVYEGLDPSTLSLQDLDFAQRTIRILSGLYGILRPLDWIQPYRLEMSTRLKNIRGKDLYAFWGDRITQMINETLTSHIEPILLNLASNEYFKVIKRTKLRARVVTPVFEDWTKRDIYKTISFYAKRARGMMARYIIDQKLETIEKIKDFTGGGYGFVENISSVDTWVFRRRIE